MPVSNFLIIKKGNYSSFQDKALSRGKKLLILKNSNVAACHPSHP